MAIVYPKYITTPSVYTKEIDLTDIVHKIDMLNYIYSVYDVIKRMYEVDIHPCLKTGDSR